MNYEFTFRIDNGALGIDGTLTDAIVKHDGTPLKNRAWLDKTMPKNQEEFVELVRTCLNDLFPAEKKSAPVSRRGKSHD